ncbi:dynamin family protein [Halomonas qinghailakensis]|uniref:Dynamin family protein n=1 Tax=Halomonas qinghailakensis TaxID=2937790 RepID=A0AA46TPE5_9GAMM|nr:dynamin family protein [Halomonas sp. ZZQ-149]UYO73932.1 dynamin family protein [Halomonas sp. ZZQ-149]
MCYQNLGKSNQVATYDRSNATKSVYYALRNFSERMNHTPVPSDGLLSARVIGEFSAGKTRLLHELLSERIPEALFPVSSLERQTRLPLEITYGHSATLELIERSEDYDEAVVVETFSTFPQREEVYDYDPSRYRLRLIITEPKLFLPNGDYFSDELEPKRLLLIDMPGWNSGEDDIAESDASTTIAGHHNLALVFVIAADRLDGQNNHARLGEFLNAFADADFVGLPTLIIVITQCPQPDQERITVRMRERIMSLWANELNQDPEELCLQLLAVDFAELSPEELVAFRDTFWTYLMAPVHQEPTSPETHPWSSLICQWNNDKDPRPYLLHAAKQLEEARMLLARASTDSKCFLPGMNMHRLIGLDTAAIQTRLLDIWRRQLQCHDAEFIAESLTVSRQLTNDHPLNVWWSHYWLPNLDHALAPTRRFFKQAETALVQVQPDTPDLRVHLMTQLSVQHIEAVQALDSSFTCLVEAAQTLTEGIPLDQTVATLLNLSLLEARYMDHYTLAKCSQSLLNPTTTGLR